MTNLDYVQCVEKGELSSNQSPFQCSQPILFIEYKYFCVCSDSTIINLPHSMILMLLVCVVRNLRGIL